MSDYELISLYYKYLGDTHRATAYSVAAADTTKHPRMITIPDDPKFTAYIKLLDVLGAGHVEVMAWLDAGILTIKQLRVAVSKGLELTPMQKIGLRYYDQLQQKLDRKTVLSAGNQIIEMLGGGEIVGSYRRGAMYCNDIDILTTSKVQIDHPCIITVSTGPRKTILLYKYTERLYVNTERLYVNTEPAYVHTNNRQRAGCIHNTHVIHVDILRTTTVEYPAALLHFTGSKLFNIGMRRYAQEHGYKLNEKGLFRGTVRIPAADELAIFQQLKLQYVIPRDRTVLKL